MQTIRIDVLSLEVIRVRSRFDDSPKSGVTAFSG
jgi:hypothetical protein